MRLREPNGRCTAVDRESVQSGEHPAERQYDSDLYHREPGGQHSGRGGSRLYGLPAWLGRSHPERSDKHMWRNSIRRVPGRAASVAHRWDIGNEQHMHGLGDHHRRGAIPRSETIACCAAATSSHPSRPDRASSHVDL
jgi:hypothetical protein